MNQETSDEIGVETVHECSLNTVTWRAHWYNNNNNNNNNREIGTISLSFRKYLSNIPGQAGSQGTTENGHTGHCTLTAECNDVKVQNMWEIKLLVQ